RRRWADRRDRRVADSLGRADLGFVELDGGIVEADAVRAGKHRIPATDVDDRTDDTGHQVRIDRLVRVERRAWRRLVEVDFVAEPLMTVVVVETVRVGQADEIVVRVVADRGQRARLRVRFGHLLTVAEGDARTTADFGSRR